MRLSLSIAAAALLICLGAASPASRCEAVGHRNAGLPVTKKVFAVSNARIDVTIEYPRTGNKAIDTALLAYVHRQLEEFRGYAKDPRADRGAFSLLTSYTVERNDGKMFAVVFVESSYTGGAHPNDFTTTFNFLLPDGAQVFLFEIVDGARGLKKISQLAAADLIANISGGSEPASDPETIVGGTGPLADNFKAFVWLPNKLHLYFPSYQVASYAAGPQEATIPLSRLKDVIRADWRAPAPSFDCAKAATPIEQAICADAALARLDRQLAEAYQAKLHFAYEPKAIETLKQTQRAWVATRNRACSGLAPGPCLMKLYRDRVAVLTKP